MFRRSIVCDAWSLRRFVLGTLALEGRLSEENVTVWAALNCPLAFVGFVWVNGVTNQMGNRKEILELFPSAYLDSR